MDGMFLIRDSTSSTQDYVVSVTHKGKVYHFQIKEIYKGHYQIDEGPIVHGKILSARQYHVSQIVSRHFIYGIGVILPFFCVLSQNERIMIATVHRKK